LLPLFDRFLLNILNHFSDTFKKWIPVRKYSVTSCICSSLLCWRSLLAILYRFENRLRRKCRHIFETPPLYPQLSPVQQRDMLVYLRLYEIVSLAFIQMASLY
jgi:hypothetical protein